MRTKKKITLHLLIYYPETSSYLNYYTTRRLHPIYSYTYTYVWKAKKMNFAHRPAAASESGIRSSFFFFFRHPLHHFQKHLSVKFISIITTSIHYTSIRCKKSAPVLNNQERDTEREKRENARKRSR